MWSETHNELTINKLEHPAMSLVSSLPSIPRVSSATSSILWSLYLCSTRLPATLGFLSQKWKVNPHVRVEQISPNRLRIKVNLTTMVT